MKFILALSLTLASFVAQATPLCNRSLVDQGVKAYFAWQQLGERRLTTCLASEIAKTAAKNKIDLGNMSAGEVIRAEYDVVKIIAKDLAHEQEAAQIKGEIFENAGGNATFSTQDLKNLDNDADLKRSDRPEWIDN